MSELYHFGEFFLKPGRLLFLLLAVYSKLSRPFGKSMVNLKCFRKDRPNRFDFACVDGGYGSTSR